MYLFYNCDVYSDKILRLKVPKGINLNKFLLEEEICSEFVRGRKADSFGMLRIYAIDNIHGQKYSSAAYELSWFRRDLLE